MTWTSDPIATVAGGEYTYKMSVMTDNLSSGLAVIVFKNSDGEIIDEEKIKQSKSLNWEMITGTVTVPKNTAYAELVLENGAKRVVCGMMMLFLYNRPILFRLT